jgi:diguanylate cyclase (GGDEF)-like protein
VAGSSDSPEQLVDQLRAAMGRMEVALGEVLEGIVWTDAEGRIEWCNQAFERLLGRSRILILGGRLTELLELEEAAGSVPTEGPPQPVGSIHAGGPARTYRWSRPTGVLFLDISVSRMVEAHGKPLTFYTIRDVTQRHSLMEELRHRALFDPVTGLANRSLFADRVDHAIARIRRHPNPIALLFLDVDDFKQINDTMGHEAGDQCLRAIGDRLGSVLRPADTLARIAGDEFAILLEDLPHAEAAEDVARRIVGAFRRPLRVADRAVTVSLSVGLDVASDEAGSPEELIGNADFAMYAAKRSGPGHWRRYVPADREAVHRRSALVTELRGAVRRNELVVYYQPIVRLDTGEVEALEALVRWQHPVRGLMMPGDFIGIAEETGLIVQVGGWVLDQACQDLGTWLKTDPGLSISVNLSPRQLQHRGVVGQVRRVLEKTGIEPKKLILEITESFLLTDEERAIARLHRLKSLGVRLAFDDFGTGYSSLSHLRRMPVDILKVDRQFVDAIDVPAGRRFLRSIVDLGSSVGVSLVAEGIERLEQIPTLVKATVLSGQGYLLARPMPAAGIAPLLRSGLRLASVGRGGLGPGAGPSAEENVGAKA